MSSIINKTMTRSDLLTGEARPLVEALNDLIRKIYSKGLFMTSWYGSLPNGGPIGLNRHGLKNLIKRILRRTEDANGVGVDNRGPDYAPLENAAADRRIPWYLYWEIFWVTKNGPALKPGTRVLDAGGTSSLFTCYLASLGCEVHSVDLNSTLVSNGNSIAKAMGWKMYSYRMNMQKLDFEDEYFDHAYSICVFEHLDYEVKQQALSEIARCLKPNGMLSLTFDYRNPAPSMSDHRHDSGARNQLKTVDDIKRNFLSTGHFDVVGNEKFSDNGESYLVHPQYGNAPYTFGAIFLKKRE